MFVETFDDGSRYHRLESDDWDQLAGKRINGHGEIVGWTNCVGELHPAYVRTEDGKLWTPADLKHADIDGRHRVVSLEVEA